MQMLKVIFGTAFASIFFILSAFAESGQTITTHETDRYFYKDGRLLKLANQFEYTYYLDLEKDTLTRTRVYDFLNKKISPDETVYHIEKQFLSHPTNAERYILKPVVRAVGQTSADTLETLVIEEGFVQALTSTADEVVISRGRRIR